MVKLPVDIAHPVSRCKKAPSTTVRLARHLHQTRSESRGCMEQFVEVDECCAIVLAVNAAYHAGRRAQHPPVRQSAMCTCNDKVRRTCQGAGAKQQDKKEAKSPKAVRVRRRGSGLAPLSPVDSLTAHGCPLRHTHTANSVSFRVCLPSPAVVILVSPKALVICGPSSHTHTHTQDRVSLQRNACA